MLFFTMCANSASLKGCFPSVACGSDALYDNLPAHSIQALCIVLISLFPSCWGFGKPYFFSACRWWVLGKQDHVVDTEWEEVVAFYSAETSTSQQKDLSKLPFQQGQAVRGLSKEMLWLGNGGLWSTLQLTKWSWQMNPSERGKKWVWGLLSWHSRE